MPRQVAGFDNEGEMAGITPVASLLGQEKADLLRRLLIDDKGLIDISALPLDTQKRLMQFAQDSRYSAADMSDPYSLMHLLLDALKTRKPNDRSEIDRRFAIAITDAERMIGFFKTYVIEYEPPITGTGNNL